MKTTDKCQQQSRMSRALNMAARFMILENKRWKKFELNERKSTAKLISATFSVWFGCFLERKYEIHICPIER